MAPTSAGAADAPVRLTLRLIRAAQGAPEAAAGLVAVIRANASVYLPLALTLAHYGAGPLDTALAEAIRDTDFTHEEWSDLEGRIPQNTGILPHTALAAADQRRQRADNDVDIALALGRLGIRLGGVGRHRDALEAAEEALELWRQLAAADPEAHTVNLARTVAGLGTRLGEVGRHRDALEAMEEALGLWRQLAAADPDPYTAGLAIVLLNYGLCLSEMGRHRDALAPAEEAVTLFARLHADLPRAYADVLAASRRLRDKLSTEQRM